MDYKKKGYDEGQVCENGNYEYSSVGELLLSWSMSDNGYSAFWRIWRGKS